MKKLVLGTAFLAMGLTPALAFGPSPSDANPPGAIFESTPNGAATSNPRGNMVNPPLDMRKFPSDGMRSSNVRLNAPPHMARHHRSPAR